MMWKKRILISLLLLFAVQVNAATYTIGSGAAQAGLGEVDATHYTTHTLLNVGEAIAAGDIISFRKGETFRETATVEASGSAGSPITYTAHGTGADPNINGADLVTTWSIVGATAVYSAACNWTAAQVFEDGPRLAYVAWSVNIDDTDANMSAGTWTLDDTNDLIYVWATDELDPDTHTMEVSKRNYAITMTGKSYITIQNLQLEKVSQRVLRISGACDTVIVEDCVIYQGSYSNSSSSSGINLANNGADVSSNCIIRNNTFGKNTGDDANDRKWSSYHGIYATNGADNQFYGNTINHSSWEEDDAGANASGGIYISGCSGDTKIYDNTIYHTGSAGIFIGGETNSGDTIKVYDNTISYAGEAGIKAYQTRGADGTGGTGYIYSNTISYANRIGGTTGGGANGNGGNEACGIHLNDSATPDGAKPFIKWYVYRNEISNCQAASSPDSEDSGGIAIDFNADGVEAYFNLIYDNWGKGIYIWNADNAKVYYNVIYGNCSGLQIGKSTETAADNEVYNNTFYKNYDADHGPAGIDFEIYFANGDTGTLIRNNILYAHDDANTFGHFNSVSGETVNNNLLYRSNGGDIAYHSILSGRTFEEWQGINSYDADSINADPLFVDAANADFHIIGSSHCVNAGVNIFLTKDYAGRNVYGVPDIGAYEYRGSWWWRLLRGPYRGRGRYR